MYAVTLHFFSTNPLHSHHLVWTMTLTSRLVYLLPVLPLPVPLPHSCQSDTFFYTTTTLKMYVSVFLPALTQLCQLQIIYLKKKIIDLLLKTPGCPSQLLLPSFFPRGNYKP